MIQIRCFYLELHLKFLAISERWLQSKWLIYQNIRRIVHPEIELRVGTFSTDVVHFRLIFSGGYNLLESETVDVHTIAEWNVDSNLLFSVEWWIRIVKGLLGM